MDEAQRQEARRKLELRNRLYEKISRGGPYRARTQEELDNGIPEQKHMAWTPKRGDRVARYFKVEPFIKLADPAKFDPMTQTFWSLPMALAWLIWRTPDAVRDHWESYRAACLDWSGKKGGYRDLGRLPPVTMKSLRLAALMGETVLTFDEAVALLVDALKAGRLTASGLPASGPAVEISAGQWEYGEIQSGGRSDREDVYLMLPRENRTVMDRLYSDLRLPRRKLMSAFAAAELKSKPVPLQYTKRDQTLATNLVAERMHIEKDLRREDAERLIGEAGLKVTGEGFKLRIWPDARQRAGLDRKAKSGRKKKRSADVEAG